MVVQADSGDASLFLFHTRFWPYGVALIECLQRAVSSIATMSKKTYIYIYIHIYTNIYIYIYIYRTLLIAGIVRPIL